MVLEGRHVLLTDGARQLKNSRRWNTVLDYNAIRRVYHGRTNRS